MLVRALAALARGGLIAIAFTTAVCAADGTAGQRVRIGAERAEIERAAQAAEQACTQRFAITACVERVKVERHQRLQRLDAELAQIDEAQRRRLAAQRVAELEARAARLGQAPATPRAATVREVGSAASAATSASRAGESLRRQAAERAVERADEQAAQRAAQTARREAQARAHRDEVERRNRERARQRVPAQPLPIPAAAAASR